MLKIQKVNAHCDIPCKIYDPYIAQFSALSIIRFIDLIAEVEDSSNKNAQAQVSRLISQKEMHAQMAKNEITVMWGDYFKEPQISKFPEIHNLVHSIMLLGSKCKQEINRSSAENFLESINKFTEIFWATKDIKTAKFIAPYPPNLPITCPILKNA
tara:strand:- start:294 stop:761 length:468 start_codon:yes stop_codon:yes gene_type:complete